jgi:hypothetical protein
MITCEDWELWIRALQLAKGANLPEFLMKYQILENSNHRSNDNQLKHAREKAQIISEHWSNYDIELTPQQIFDFYYNETKISKAQFKSNCKMFIQAFNLLYEKRSVDLNKNEKSSLAYMLSRKISNYWRRSGVSRMNPIIWLQLVSEVRFVSRIKWIKGVIR